MVDKLIKEEIVDIGKSTYKIQTIQRIEMIKNNLLYQQQAEMIFQEVKAKIGKQRRINKEVVLEILDKWRKKE